MVYERFSIQVEEGDRDYSYSQAFFLSRTTFEEPAYPVSTVKELLERTEIDPREYRQHGIFVIRSTVMTPYIVFASETGRKQEYLADFMEVLAKTVSICVSDLRE